MTYVIVALVVVVLVAIAPFVRRLLRGQRLISSMLSGKFDQSPVGQQFAAWFNERPEREEQRKLFVDLALALHSPSGIVSERLMHCIMEAWGGHGARFGDLLAHEIDRAITFPEPKSAEQAEQRRIALEGLVEIKTRLRELD